MVDKNRVKIGFISWNDPNDRRTLSGTPYKICEQLKNIGCEIIWIKVNRTYIYRIYNKVISVYNKFARKRIDVSHSVIGASLQSNTIDSSLVSKCDIIFAPFASEALYKLHTDRPIIYLSDATFSIMVDYYFKNLTKCSINQGNEIEKTALNKATSIIVSSDWARNSVINDYHQPEGKVHVIEFGANIDEKDIIPHKYNYDGHLDILFLGVDWKRKGGTIAVDCCRWLNDNGIPTTLHIVGIKHLDNSIANLPFIDNAGFLNKNIPEQYNKLVSIIEKCHCLLLPTLAECSAIAFSESSANGLPIFSHDTGGVRNYVEDGRNGYLLPIGSTGKDFGNKIKNCLISGELEHLSETAKEVYKTKLNWQIWGSKVREIIDQLYK